MVTTAFNRFFDGEAVRLAEMKELIGSENEALFTLVINVGYVCGLVVKLYEPGGEKRQLTPLGKGFYDLVAGLYEDGKESEE